MKPVQYFSDEYLESCRTISADEVVRFLESFRLLHAPARRSKLISMKVHEELLDAFKLRCRAEGVRYQTRIKELMQAWLVGEPPGKPFPAGGVAREQLPSDGSSNDSSRATGSHQRNQGKTSGVSKRPAKTKASRRSLS